MKPILFILHPSSLHLSAYIGSAYRHVRTLADNANVVVRHLKRRIHSDFAFGHMAGDTAVVWIHGARFAHRPGGAKAPGRHMATLADSLVLLPVGGGIRMRIVAGGAGEGVAALSEA